MDSNSDNSHFDLNSDEYKTSDSDGESEDGSESRKKVSLRDTKMRPTTDGDDRGGKVTDVVLLF